jgi:hypothetical protein
VFPYLYVVATLMTCFYSVDTLRQVQVSDTANVFAVIDADV